MYKFIKQPLLNNDVVGRVYIDINNQEFHPQLRTKPDQ